MIEIDKQKSLIDKILNGENPKKEYIERCNLNYSNQEIDTPLITAAMSGKKDWILFLLDNGADINATNQSGNNVFRNLKDYSDEQNREEITKFLCEYKSPQERMKQQMVTFAMGTHKKPSNTSSIKILREGKNDILPLIGSHLKNSK